MRPLGERPRRELARKTGDALAPAGPRGAVCARSRPDPTWAAGYVASGARRQRRRPGTPKGSAVACRGGREPTANAQVEGGPHQRARAKTKSRTAGSSHPGCGAGRTRSTTGGRSRGGVRPERRRRPGPPRGFMRRCLASTKNADAASPNMTIAISRGTRRLGRLHQDAQNSNNGEEESAGCSAPSMRHRGQTSSILSVWRR